MSGEFIRLKTKLNGHFQRFTVAIAVERDHLVGINAAGALVPAQDATCTLALGYAKQQGAVDELVDVGFGWMAFDNDGTTAVGLGNIGEIGKVGADAAGISISPNAGILSEVGRIKAIDNEGSVWVDTNDR